MNKVIAVYESKARKATYFEVGRGRYAPFSTSLCGPEGVTRGFFLSVVLETTGQLPEDAVDVSEKYQHILN